MTQVFRWKCPYCGKNNQAVHQDSHGYHDIQIVTCDSEEGGCDKQVVLRSHVEVSWETYTFDQSPATSGQVAAV